MFQKFREIRNNVLNIIVRCKISEIKRGIGRIIIDILGNYDDFERHY